MTSRRRSLRAIASLCDAIGPEDGIDPRHVRRGTSRKKSDRKTWQLCREVERALHIAIAELGDEEARSLRVVGVEPAPDSGHLRVLVTTESGGEADALQLLKGAEGPLRAAAASAIHRKRAPELSFVVVPGAGVLP